MIAQIIPSERSNRTSSSQKSALACILGAALVAWVMPLSALATEGSRCLLFEFYFTGSQKSEAEAATALDEYARSSSGIALRLVDLEKAPQQRERASQLWRHYRLKEQTPLLFGVGQAAAGETDFRGWQRRLDSLRTMTVFARQGCPRCTAAKEYLKTYTAQYPGLIVAARDIAADPEANQSLHTLLSAHRVTAASVPVLAVCDQVVVGFTDAKTTGARIEGILRPWTTPCHKAQEKRPASTKTMRMAVPPTHQLVRLVKLTEEKGTTQEVPEAELAEPFLPLPGETPSPGLTSEAASDEIELPMFGRLRVSSLGLPLFTIMIGLVDGFNPCAMWVLVFLLSVLVNLRSRLKILAVAATFVATSGIMYFAFMAAWINVFQLIGLTRFVQIALGVVAIGIGSIHVKDFFAFKQGITLSIPESAKPKIYERVRRIVNAENLVGAILGAAGLAVLVNFVELLCTAGLPALYTQILAAHQLPRWADYAYLLLYNLAYMFDDSLMVALVVITLGRRKMQENEGRWLKLISGIAVIMLGLAMLCCPQFLGM